jgi:ATP-binding cassette subfamily C (CFTR/MRP) protein 4
MSECCVSLRRIQAFLETPELNSVISEASLSSSMPNSSIGSKALYVDHVTCFWNSNVAIRESTVVKDDLLASPLSDDNECLTLEEKTNAFNNIALSNITVDFETSSITFIIGMVGSGKSALLQALMGELPVTKGRIERRYKTLAYSPQDPWIMNGTIRENILMGLPLDESFYEQVVTSCSLSFDFSLFQKGDQTLVGDRGVQLSGGQRARISLARALYRDSDVLLLDDPLSAVDAKVGRLIFYSAINDLCLKRGKAVILVTHQYQFIGDSRCILMSGGKIAHVGSLVDCVNVSDGNLNVTVQSLNESDDDITVPNEKMPQLSSINVAQVSLDVEDYHANNSSPDTEMSETKASGGISRGALVNYFRAMGGCVIAVKLLVLFTITQASTLSSILVMGRWAQRSPIRQRDSSLMCLVTGLSCSVLLLSITRSLVTFARTIRASQKLHDDMTKSVFRATIEFFDINPSGRILNRFSSDVGSNDDTLPFTLYEFLSSLFMTLGAIVTCIVILPFTLVVIPPLLWFFLRSRSIYVTTSRELKRLEGIARSPIYSMLNESFHGVATIRTNDAVSFFKEKFEKLQNDHSRAFFASAAGSRWVGFRMDSVMFVVTTAACYLAVLFNQQGTDFLIFLVVLVFILIPYHPIMFRLVQCGWRSFRARSDGLNTT